MLTSRSSNAVNGLPVGCAMVFSLGIRAARWLIDTVVVAIGTFVTRKDGLNQIFWRWGPVGDVHGAGRYRCGCSCAACQEEERGNSNAAHNGSGRHHAGRIP